LGAIGESDSAQAALAAIVTLTELMLRTARDQDWLAVADQETRRRQLLAAVFAESQAFETQALKATIRRVLELDGEIVALGEASRHAIGGQLDRLQHGRRATLAYRDAGD
jgi:hypothetical protein